MSERPEIAPITATMQQFMKLSGFGRTMVYKLIDDGDIQSVTIGRRRMIILESYRALLRSRLPVTVRHEPAPPNGSGDGSDSDVGRKPLENIHG